MSFQKHKWSLVSFQRRCLSTHLGVSCDRIKGHDGKHSGLERGRWEDWQWSDDPDDVLISNELGSAIV